MPLTRCGWGAGGGGGAAGLWDVTPRGVEVRAWGTVWVQLCVLGGSMDPKNEVFGLFAMLTQRAVGYLVLLPPLNPTKL